MGREGFITKKKLVILGIFFGVSFCLFPFGKASALAIEDKVILAESLTHHAVGYMYDLLGAPDRAALEYKKALFLDGASYVSHLRLGTAYARLDMIEEAEKELKLVTQYNPEELQSRYLLALIYSATKQYDKAAYEYEAILKSFSKTEPDNIDIYDYLGRLYYSQKKFSQAISQYEKILQIEPKNADVMYLLGTLYWEVQDKDKAIAILKKSLEIDPGHDGSLNTLGYFYAESGTNLDEAELLVKKALEIDPENGGYIDSLGWVFYKKGDYQRAFELLKKAGELLNEAVIFDHLGDVAIKLNLNQEAIRYWNKSLELSPGQQEIIKKIEQAGTVQASNNSNPEKGLGQ